MNSEAESSDRAGSDRAIREGTAVNGGVRIHWNLTRRTDGLGLPLVVINGLGSPLVAFEPGFVDLLVDRGLDVLRLDNRDVGRSDRVERGPARAPTPYTLADMAGDVVAAMGAVGWESAHVLGQSMGGMIAQQLAIGHAGVVRSLVLFMTSSGERGHGSPTAEAAEALLRPAPLEREAWVAQRAETERVWGSPEHATAEWLRAKGEAMWDHGVDSAGAIRQYRAVAKAGSRDLALAGLDVPTLVMHGSADTLIPPSGGRHLADVVPGARYHEIAGLGHDLPPGLWGTIVDEVASFIEDIGPRPAPVDR